MCIRALVVRQHIFTSKCTHRSIVQECLPAAYHDGLVSINVFDSNVIPVGITTKNISTHSWVIESKLIIAVSTMRFP